MNGSRGGDRVWVKSPSVSSYRKLFYRHKSLPLVACVVFFLSASLVLFQDENYWLAALVAVPPTASILAFWCVQGRKLDRWVCPRCLRPMPKEWRILPRLDPPKECSSCGAPINYTMVRCRRTPSRAN